MGEDNPNGFLTKVEMQMIVENIGQNMDEYKQFEEYKAVLYRQKYQALTNKGFTKNEALALLKARGTILDGEDTQAG